MTRPGTTIVSSLLVARAAGHAALYSPVPRNANDRDLPLFSGGKSPKCPCTCDNGMGTRGGPWPNNAPCSSAHARDGAGVV